MAHQLFDLSPSPTPDPERGSFQGTRSIIHESVCTTDPTGIARLDSKWNWNHRMRRLIPRPSIGVFIILVFVTGVSFCPALLSNAKPFDFIVLDGVPPEVDGVKILGTIFSFDWLDPSTISVTWSISAVGNYTLQTAYGFSNNTPPPNVAMDIYLNDPSKPIFSYDPADLPLQWDGGVLPVQSAYSFNMVHYIETGVQFFAPEDLYSFSASVFAIERPTNKSIPIITFEVGSSGPGDFGSTSEVVPTTGHFTYDPGSGPVTVEVHSDTIFASVSRSIPARALTYSMFAINWVLAFCSIVTTSVAFSRVVGEGEAGITLLPITVILTIPAIRNLYVGAPPFGIFLDVVGFFPQMLIVASCTVIVLTGYALQTMRSKRVDTERKGGV